MDLGEIIPPLLYEQVIQVAKTRATELKPHLPTLPTNEELEPIIGKIYAVDRPLVDTVRRHLDEWGQGHGHEFEHLEWVAASGVYAAALECDERGIRGEIRNEILRRTWRLGLIHDLQRWRGFDKIHGIEGMKAARQKFSELGLEDELLTEQVLIHDDPAIMPRNDPRFDIPMFSVFAVDHLNWGLEWEEVRWRGFKRNGTPVSEIIH